MCFGSAADLNRKNLYEALKQGSRTTTGARRKLLEGFVVAQIALTLILLTGAGLMVENFQRLSHRSLGVEADKTLTLVCSLPRTRYLAAEQRENLVRQILDSVRAVPGVSAAGISTVNPIYLYTGTWGARVMRKGANVENGIVVNHRLITPDLLRSLGIPIREGRGFTEQDTETSEPVAIVSRALAERLWRGENAVGKQIQSMRRGGVPQYRTVVGVAADVQAAGDYRETWYVPYAQDPTGPSSEELHIMVRTDGDAAALAHTVAAAVWKVDNALPLRNIARLDHLYSSTLVREHTGAVTGSLFSTFGLILATLGAFGVISFAVYQRTHEIGVRVTLGADSANIVAMVLSSGLRLAAAGIVIGLIGSVALNRVLAGMLPGVGKLESSVYFLGALVLTLATVTACWIPARRASKVDPIIALRCE